MKEEVVFATPWFDLVANYPPNYEAAHYSIRTLDYVVIVATTAENHLVLVRQFRPAVGQTTLEIPAGHVERGETPEQAARRELLEETGYQAARFHLLGALSPDTGRLSNRMWCYFAGDVTQGSISDYPAEAGIEVVLYNGSLHHLMSEPDFSSALNSAALLLAVMQGHLSLPNQA
jgi:8-oxo-dGTP pyrophosphatase MutT (NUDIX family)